MAQGTAALRRRAALRARDAFVIIYRLLNRLGKNGSNGCGSEYFHGCIGWWLPMQNRRWRFWWARALCRGTAGLLNPTGNITRAETAVILYRIVTMFGCVTIHICILFASLVLNPAK